MLLENWPPFNSLQDSCFSCCPKANLFPYAALVRWEQQRLRNTSMIEAKEAAIAVPQRASRRSPDPGVRNLIHEAVIPWDMRNTFQMDISRPRRCFHHIMS